MTQTELLSANEQIAIVGTLVGTFCVSAYNAWRAHLAATAIKEIHVMVNSRLQGVTLDYIETAATLNAVVDGKSLADAQAIGSLARRAATPIALVTSPAPTKGVVP